MSGNDLAPLRIGTRSSPLALWQAHYVSDALATAGIESTLCPVRTQGDQNTHTPLHAIGDISLFVKELEMALARQEVDLAVHSAKDVPSVLSANFELVAFTSRANVADVIVTPDKEFSLNAPYCVGTSAVRRVALLRRYYPHWRAVSIRGNVNTRLALLQEGRCDAMVLAAAALERLGVPKGLYVHPLDPNTFVPAPGQASLAIEVLACKPKAWKHKLSEVLNHPPTAAAITAERAFVATIQGGCSTPQYAWAQWIGNQIQLRAGIIHPKGHTYTEAQQTNKGTAPHALGVALARKILQLGAQELLDEIVT